MGVVWTCVERESESGGVAEASISEANPEEWKVSHYA